MITQLTEIKDGRLVPSTKQLDADLIEVSKEEGNSLEVKPDGLYYKTKVMSSEDGLTLQDGKLGIEEEGIPLTKLEKVSPGLLPNTLPATELLSIKDHLANLYKTTLDLRGSTEDGSTDIIYDLEALSRGFDMLQNRLITEYYAKGYIDELAQDTIDRDASLSDRIDNTYTKAESDMKIVDYDREVASKFALKTEVPQGSLLYGVSGLVSNAPKFFTGVAMANGDGDWTIDYSSAGFTQIPTVIATGQSTGTAAADRRYASINPDGPGLTSCSGKLASASSAGLLAAMTMIAGDGPVHILAIGV